MLLMTLLHLLLLWQLMLLLLLFLPLTLLKCADNLALAALHLLHPQLLHLPSLVALVPRGKLACLVAHCLAVACLVVACLVSIYTAEDSPHCLTL